MLPPHRELGRSRAYGTARLASAVVLVGVAVGGLLVRTTADSRPSVIERSGSLSALVEAFTRGIPGRGSGAYASPAAGESEQLGRAFTALEHGNPGQAARDADGLGYDVVRLEDPARGRFLILRERAGAVQRRHWGLFVHRLDARSQVAIEVPHPRSDIASELVGLELYSYLRARNLLIAGAHRRANPDEGDVAHDPYSPFAAVSRSSVRPGIVVVQPHGFDEHRASRSGYGEVVLSSGERRPRAIVERVAAALGRTGIDVCVFGAGRCRDLGATTNVEGQAARAAGAEFLQVEIAREIRVDPRRRQILVAALASGLRP